MRMAWITAIATFALVACGNLSGTGACVSQPAEYQHSFVVFCYDEQSKDDCEFRDIQHSNGVNWSYHGGQTCEEQGLEEGGNSTPKP